MTRPRPTLTLRLFGGLSLADETGPVTGRAAQRRRLALLAILAAARGRPVSRDKLVAFLWPEASGDRARHLLADSLYVIRGELGDDVIRAAGSDLALDRSHISSDTMEFADALEAGDRGRAVAIYANGGPFLDGVFVTDSGEFDQWVDSTRSGLTEDYRRALRELANAATDSGDHAAAIDWWRRLAADDRLNSRVALGLMRALAAGGDRAGALDFARAHADVVRAELESAPDAAVVTFEVELRALQAEVQVPPPDVDSVRFIDSPPSSAPARKPRSRRGFLAAAVILTLAVVGYGLARPSGATPGAGLAGARMARPTEQQNRSPNPEAFALYLKGSDQRLMRSDSTVRIAVDYFNRAVAADSSFVAAYAGLARSYSAECQGSWPLPQRRSACDSAAMAATRAIVLDSTLADGYVELSYARGMLLDIPGALAAAERAVRVDPNHGEAHQFLGVAYEWFGRTDEALAEARHALDLDPLSVSAIAEVGRALFYAGHDDEALASLAPLRSVRPPVRRVRTIVGLIYAKKRMWREAMAEFGGPAPPGGIGHPGLVGRALAESGRRTEAEAIVTKLKTQWSSGNAKAFEVAMVYVGLGDFDSAFAWIDKSIDDFSLRVDIMDPTFEEFRKDSRFAHVKERLQIASR
ncbi:MAG: BTAD domain-containing putative transcriptional regulator [Gemmatimonadales bacterium]